MSDLQCPAVVLLVAGESIATGGARLALGATRLSGVFVASPVAADPNRLAAATRLAEERACPVDRMLEVVDGASLAEAVEHLADLYRGETIAVIATGEMVRDALGHPGTPTEPIAVSIDGDGWVVIDRR